ncbi:MAG: ferric reductase-like transmembrane domain-containing protein [Candidatus Dormibacteria bacterium]
MTPPSAAWYFARSAGFVSLVLLATTVALGLVLSTRMRSPRWPRFVTEGLHRYLGTVLYSFISIHVVTLLLDPFIKFSLVDVVVPFATSYRTFWTGLGISVAELTLALGLSIHLRTWMGYRAWRIMHYGTYVIFPAAWLHGIFTGTDSRTWWGLTIYAATGSLVGAMALLRASGPVADPARAERVVTGS